VKAPDAVVGRFDEDASAERLTDMLPDQARGAKLRAYGLDPLTDLHCAGKYLCREPSDARSG